jgi:hypothetical protein
MDALRFVSRARVLHATRGLRNPNFARFKTWDWDCANWALAWGLAGPGGARLARCCPRFYASHTSFPPPSHLIIVTCLHCLSLSLSHSTTPQRSCTKVNVSHIHQEPGQNANVCNVLHRGGIMCVAGWLQICALLIRPCNLIHPPHPDNKFEIRLHYLLITRTKLQARSTRPENVVPPLHKS